MKVVILCGGLGTRLREETEARPKPMVEIGGQPILWHIMRGYASYGFTEFILALGIPVTEMWGMSECAGVPITNLPGATRFGVSCQRHRPGASGRAQCIIRVRAILSRFHPTLPDGVV